MAKPNSKTATGTEKSRKPRSRAKKATTDNEAEPLPLTTTKRGRKIMEPTTDDEAEPPPLTTTKCGRKIKASAPPDADSTVGRLNWTTARIDRAIEWCEENPEDRQKLFSDSTQAAKDQSRRKLVSKTPKAHYHQKIANHVFSVDEDAAVRQDFKKNPLRYTKSVDNLFTR